MSDQVETNSWLHRAAGLARRAAPLVLTACAASMLTLIYERSHHATRQPSTKIEAVFAAPGETGVLEHRNEDFRDFHIGPVSEQEWKEAEHFFQEISPARLNHINDLREGEPRARLKRLLVARYRGLIKVKAESSDLYDIRVREMKLDDEVFAICLAIKRGVGDKQHLQADLSSRVAELVSLGIDERKLRIGQVEKSLGKEKLDLVHDEQSKAALAKKQYEYVLANGVEGARFDTRRTSPKSSPGSTTAPSSEE